MQVYFDNAATTAVDPEVADAMIPVLRNQFGNPSSIHAFGRAARTEIEKARKLVSGLIGCSTSEIFFTSGGTEANNMAIRCTIEQQGITHAITSPTEHHAVLHTLEELEHKGKIKLSILNVDNEGKFSFDELEQLLAANPGSFVSIMHANNEIGTKVSLHEIGNLVKNYGGVFHSDTVQTMGHYGFNLFETPVDFVNCAAHKFHGPKGVGFIYIDSNTKIHPFITGGAQERNMRGGTENIYGIVGLAKAMEIAHREMDAHTQHIRAVKNYMVEQLRNTFEGIRFNGDISDDSLYTVLNVSFPANEINEMLLFNLDIHGIAASGGSACSSGSEIGSHVLKAINADKMRGNVRFSFSKFNTKQEVDFVIKQLQSIYQLTEKAIS